MTAAIDPVAEALHGYRYIGLVVDPQFPASVFFSGVNSGGAMAAQAEAVCRRGRPHRAPSWDCTCGFYSCATLEELTAVTHSMPMDNLAALCLAEVDVWGHIVQHEQGMRSQFQQVTSIEVQPCACKQKASGFRVAANGSLTPTCGFCEEAAWTFEAVADQLDVIVTVGDAAFDASDRTNVNVFFAALGFALITILLVLMFTLGRGISPWIRLSPVGTGDEFAISTAFSTFQYVALGALATILAAVALMTWHGTGSDAPHRKAVTVTVVGVLAAGAVLGYVTAPGDVSAYTVRNYLRSDGWAVLFDDGDDTVRSVVAVDENDNLCVFDVTLPDPDDVQRVTITERSCQPVAADTD